MPRDERKPTSTDLVSKGPLRYATVFAIQQDGRRKYHEGAREAWPWAGDPDDRRQDRASSWINDGEAKANKL